MIVYRELSTVAEDLGISLQTLYSVSNTIPAHYRQTSIPKKSGGVRELNVPDELLKSIQRAIVDKLLCYAPVSEYAHAYRYGTSVQSNARPHVGKKKLLKLDISKFFDSILYSDVKNCCFPPSVFCEPARVLLSMLCYCGDSLPQGAPTSPIISNIIMRDFDERVGRYCKQLGVTYTRYCDDMTFSGDFNENDVISFVRRELERRGLLLNKEKTAIIRSNKRQTVTGIVVNEKLGVTSEYKRKIRQEVYYCKKYGSQSHIRTVSPELSEIDYLRGLLGRIAFVLQTDPDNQTFLGYKTFIKALLKGAEYRRK